jgi:hypothetical protein
MQTQLSAGYTQSAVASSQHSNRDLNKKESKRAKKKNSMSQAKQPDPGEVTDLATQVEYEVRKEDGAVFAMKINGVPVFEKIPPVNPPRNSNGKPIRLISRRGCVSKDWLRDNVTSKYLRDRIHYPTGAKKKQMTKIDFSQYWGQAAKTAKEERNPIGKANSSEETPTIDGSEETPTIDGGSHTASSLTFSQVSTLAQGAIKTPKEGGAMLSSSSIVQPMAVADSATESATIVVSPAAAKNPLMAPTGGAVFSQRLSSQTSPGPQREAGSDGEIPTIRESQFTIDNLLETPKDGAGFSQSSLSQTSPRPQADERSHGVTATIRGSQSQSGTTPASPQAAPAASRTNVDQKQEVLPGVDGASGPDGPGGSDALSHSETNNFEEYGDQGDDYQDDEEDGGDGFSMSEHVADDSATETAAAPEKAKIVTVQEQVSDQDSLMMDRIFQHFKSQRFQLLPSHPHAPAYEIPTWSPPPHMTPLFNDFAIMCDYWAFEHVFSRSPEGVLTFTDAEKCDPKLTQQCYGLMSFPYDEFYIDRIITFVSSSQEEKESKHWALYQTMWANGGGEELASDRCHTLQEGLNDGIFDVGGRTKLCYKVSGRPQASFFYRAKAP